MKKLSLKKQPPIQNSPTRITNETVAEHRERILAGGRRFKYPMQYARHRLVFNTILVVIAALILFVAFCWWQLYSVQNTSSFFYRLTRVVPLPVASVDGESVRYGDYLMYYNSSAHYLSQSEQINLQSEDGKRQLNYIKRKSLDNIEADAYATKLARNLHVTVSNEQVDKVIDEDRNTVSGRISQETYDASALSVLGWSPEEYRQDAKAKLIRQEVSYAVDTIARQKQEAAAQLLAQPGADLNKAAAQLGGEGAAKAVVATSGLVPRSNRDGGLSSAAIKLEKGQISPVVKTTTGDGYYFVQLLDKNSTHVSYAYLRIPLTEFTTRLEKLKKDNRIHEYISIPKVESQKLN